ncbi:MULTISPECIES: hypothetical protein [Reichenbachiella]|uniref:DUF4062 domain-containing protein n=1 Tax=Reichenbachiella agariperforans TaxID=156994 RepID=A0A1M6WHA4_REIAG|nr:MULTISPECIES: hypothetical protein [Reichenbachiella]MBU2912482.1 hypothetical protein [Reichenbachiella agariperforans]RJE72653.1 hypothetical protein BGP76_01430 [Reichenbachiella sp. MSK19-1]SHK92994.1 hypothetical protein SAMN04488028_11226 [Reichenbachiella agariperforans]
MKFEHDILLAYHTLDDEPIGGGSKGWVTNFYRFLSTLVEQVSGTKSKIKMVNEKDSHVDLYNGCSVLVPIFSKHFLSNPTLINGVNLFASSAKENNNLQMDGLSRLLKVIKFPIDVDEYLPDYSDILSYDFYQIDSLTGEPQEFRRFFGNEAERSYWMKMVDMAYDIHQIQKKMSEVTSKETVVSEVTREKTIYLANSGVDMIIQRDIVKRELIRHGYRVLPDQSLPKEIHALESAVKRDLAACCLSIHLIGEDYGYSPRGSELSIVDIQNKLASMHTFEMHEQNKRDHTSEKFSRLIWLSPDLKNVTERQKIFIEDLKTDAAALDEAEVLQIPLQELKSIIREELVTGGRFKAKEVKRDESLPDEGNIIYLICDQLDVEASQPVFQYLKKKGYNVVTTLFEGQLMDLRYLHQENLRRCDASLIYFGRSSEDWIRTKLQDLLKAPGFGRTKPMRASAIYAEDKTKLINQNVQLTRTMVLGDSDFSPNTLEPFLAKLEN